MGRAVYGCRVAHDWTTSAAAGPEDGDDASGQWSLGFPACCRLGRGYLSNRERVRSVAGAARGCYDAADPSVEGVGEADFAAMMFLDGCFLLQYMVDSDDAAPVLRNRMTLSTGPSIQKDIFRQPYGREPQLRRISVYSHRLGGSAIFLSTHEYPGCKLQP
ncbi:hypothetical protein C2845_PM14G01480 [Panicum miliaceum]|uniref:Uncharacterized protein n=1 Tax=Panicum miliaceum TaxID=4540 RepID=A0A3L6PPC8_PANMI|nr:hypothetical protein C2845_PM14G01480 [Panicum miliaceum]